MMHRSHNRAELLEKVNNAISPYPLTCDGFGSPLASGKSYFLGAFMGVGVTKKKFGHKGSTLLDEINAFDIAETDFSYIGQINMSIVSSFCGPQGIIWGYDFAKHPKLRQRADRKTFPESVRTGKFSADVYQIEPLLEATQQLFGTVDKRLFPLQPGAHVPCAGKNIKIHGAGRIYSGVALAIAEDRVANANLLMEDVGEIPLDFSATDMEVKHYEDMIRRNLAESVLQIGINQNVTYKEIFVGVKSVYVPENEIGCALVAFPYFTLAQEALPNEKNILESSVDSLAEWVKYAHARV
jgi:histidine decarboxylase